MLRWLELSLRARFALGLAAALLPFLLAAGVGQFYLLPRLVGPLDAIVYQITEEMRAVAALEIALLSANHASHNLIIRGDAVARGVFERSSRRVAVRIREQVWPVDRVVRYGGDEFAAILTETDGAGALAFAERLRAAIAAVPFALDVERLIDVTAGIGVASFPRDGEIERAIARSNPAAI